MVEKAKGVLGIGKKETEKPKKDGEDGEFIYEKHDGAHTIKIRRDLTVVKFSNPTVDSGAAAQAACGARSATFITVSVMADSACDVPGAK